MWILLLLFLSSCYQGWENIKPDLPDKPNPGKGGNGDGPQAEMVFLVHRYQPDEATLSARVSWSPTLIAHRYQIWATRESKLTAALLATATRSTNRAHDLAANAYNSSLESESAEIEPAPKPSEFDGIIGDIPIDIAEQFPLMADLEETVNNLQPSTTRIIRVRLVFDHGYNFETPSSEAVLTNIAALNKEDSTGQALFVTYMCQDDFDDDNSHYWAQYADIAGDRHHVYYCQEPFREDFLVRDDAGATELVNTVVDRDVVRFSQWLQGLLSP